MTDGETHELDPSSDLPVPPELDGSSPEGDETGDDLDSWDEAGNCNLFQGEEDHVGRNSALIFQKTLLRSFNPYKRNLPLKKDCYFTQKKTVISRKKRLLFSSKKDSYFFKPNIIMCMFVAC